MACVDDTKQSTSRQTLPVHGYAQCGGPDNQSRMTHLPKSSTSCFAKASSSALTRSSHAQARSASSSFALTRSSRLKVGSLGVFSNCREPDGDADADASIALLLLPSSKSALAGFGTGTGVVKCRRSHERKKASRRSARRDDPGKVPGGPWCNRDARKEPFEPSSYLHACASMCVQVLALGGRECLLLHVCV